MLAIKSKTFLMQTCGGGLRRVEVNGQQSTTLTCVLVVGEYGVKA